LISSTAGIRGIVTNVDYQVAKGALPQFARALAREFANDNIRVNCVAPGVVRTDFHQTMTAEQRRLNLEQRIPLHREGTPAQVAELILTLVRNDYITGETMTIDGGLTIGGLTTLDSISSHATIRERYQVLAEAAQDVATPQIRNVATIGGNVCQRPWCWYLRNGFHCYKNGGNVCYSVSGENQFHAIFGGGPSHIVHPSDTAPALVALNATFRLVGPSGERTMPAADFFALPTVDPARENVLKADEVLASIAVPALPTGARSTYHKVMDREAWTHAVVSAAIVLDMNRNVCRSARVVLGGVAPIPWRVPDVERMLAGQRITPELAARAGEAAVAGARPLAKNGYGQYLLDLIEYN
jgi:xanthine dehydrogenase YagS FAD-binding subunit